MVRCETNLMLTLKNSILATASDLDAIFSSTLNLNERYNHATRVDRALEPLSRFLDEFKNPSTHGTLYLVVIIRFLLRKIAIICL